MRPSILLSALLLLGTTGGTAAWAVPPSQGNIEGTYITVNETGQYGAWTMESFEALKELRQLNPALSSIRPVDLRPGDAVAPGETVTLRYGGLDRAYVSILRYRPSGRAELLMKNRYFNKLENRSWLFEVVADDTEGGETFVSVTSREAIPDDWFDANALMPQMITLNDGIAGSGYTWYRVLNQTGMQLDRSGGQPFSDGQNPSYNHQQYSYTEEGTGGVTQTTNWGIVNQNLMNPYAAYGGMTANQPNPYYRPIPQAGSYRFNPFLHRYGYLPYYSPAPFQVWVGPGGSIGQPYYMYDMGGVGVLPSEFYIAPNGRGVRTNFNDVLFSADITSNGLILRGGDDFIEGELSLGGREGFSLRLRDVRDSRGYRYHNGQPIIIFIDGQAFFPRIDPNTGDFILPLPSQPGMQGGLGSRIRVAPANIRTGPIGIGRIDVVGR